MRERMDFSSISGIIRENMGMDGLSDEELFYTLFFYAFEQEKYQIPMPGISDISRYLNGQRGITKAMLQLYKEDDNVRYLKQGVSKILNYATDTAWIVEQLLCLLRNDLVISDSKKKELSNHSKDAGTFIADCLMFGMARDFIPKGADRIRKSDFLLSDFLLDNRVPSVGKVFVGRERELNEIHARLKDEDCLFLEGIGGIGKSELIKQYARHHKKEYKNIIYLRYIDSLKETIANLSFVDDKPDQSEEERFRGHYHLFQILQQDSLVILDNFDTTTDRDELFYNFQSFPFVLLVTTRCHFDDVPVYPVHEIDSQKQLLELFYAYAPSAKCNETAVIEIIEEVHCHTLTVEMAAKTITACALPPEELLCALRADGFQGLNQNKIGITKDLQRKNASIYRHLKILLRLQELSKEKLGILRSLTLVKDSGIDKRIFCKWLQLPDFNWINELIEAGWVKQDEESGIIAYHPFIREMILTFQRPTTQNCESLFLGIKEDFSLENFSWESIDQVKFKEINHILKNLFRCIEPDKPDAYSNCLSIGYNEFAKSLGSNLSLLDKPLPQDMAFYHLLRGSVALKKMDVKAAEQEFEQSISFAALMDEENSALESNLYFYLWQCGLQQYIKTVKEGQPNEELFPKCQKNIDYALKSKKISEQMDVQDTLNISIEGVPFSGDALLAKEVLSKFMEECKDFSDSNVLLRELYRIAEDLEACTASYAKEDRKSSNLTTYYQALHTMQKKCTSGADSKKGDTDINGNAIINQ